MDDEVEREELWNGLLTWMVLNFDEMCVLKYCERPTYHFRTLRKISSESPNRMPPGETSYALAIAAQLGTAMFVTAAWLAKVINV